MQKNIDGIDINGSSILTSLKIIKTVCDDNYKDGNCEPCPFCVKGTCAICDLYPTNWKIGTYKKWQALE